MNEARKVAVIVDIVRSKEHDDRSILQREVVDSFAAVNQRVEAMQPLVPTIGDEFQAVYDSVPAALRATLLARLYLPAGVDCRFGLGEGTLTTVGTGLGGAIQDGPAWWSARDAIERARAREYSRFDFVRTWFVSSEDSPESSSMTQAALINAYLVCRDQIVSTMKPRARRSLRGLLMNQTQVQIAAAEGVTQSAISQTLHNSGAIALLASEQLLIEALA